MSYVFLDWNRGRWEPSYPPAPGWLTPEVIGWVPEPKYFLGDTVTFRWSYPSILTGDIRRIQAYVELLFLEDLGPFTQEQIVNRTKIYLTVHANAHARWFQQKEVIKRGG